MGGGREIEEGWERKRGRGTGIGRGRGRGRGRGIGRGRHLPFVASLSLDLDSGKEKGFDVNIEELSNFPLNITYGRYYSTESSEELMFSFSKSTKCNTEA